MNRIDSETIRQDYFSLFGLPRRQELDAGRLDALYRDVQSKVHPDKHAHLADSDKRMAMQWSTHVNEAYQTLRNPLKRARYLLQLAGQDVALESNTAMPAEFLMAQMELREQVADAREAGDADALDVLHRRLNKEIRTEHIRLQQELDAGHLDRAGEMVRQLMFQEKLIHEVDDALELIER